MEILRVWETSRRDFVPSYFSIPTTGDLILGGGKEGLRPTQNLVVSKKICIHVFGNRMYRFETVWTPSIDYHVSQETSVVIWSFIPVRTKSTVPVKTHDQRSSYQGFPSVVQVHVSFFEPLSSWSLSGRFLSRSRPLGKGTQTTTTTSIWNQI